MSEDTCHWDDPEYRREQQRKYRASRKRRGYRRLEISLSPATWERLAAELSPLSALTHPGAAVSAWIERMVTPE